MRHLNAHRKLGRTSEHRMSMLRNLATSLINARDSEDAARGRKQAEIPRTAGVAALKRLFGELGERYAGRPGGYTRIIRLGRRDGDNAELAIIELVDSPREREALDSKKAKTAGKKKSAKAGAKAETSSAESTKKASGGGRRSKKTE